ncbi:zn(2)-C6 fungal-type transcription factor [Rhodotorula toruloides]|uniref:Zn(2)-C6 fungal-type transcription factor n=1 Tax=Rhodotorula toruloides TaxID=5286 RepID=A0A511KJK7_RHOTO|nr:zn(2)-C6 fungal-type transcription factor [Rhodotorula toruloides]
MLNGAPNGPAAAVTAQSVFPSRASASPTNIATATGLYGSDGGAVGGGTDGQGERKKRKKNPRACDYCRAHKLKCEYMPDRDPPFCFGCQKRGLVCEAIQPTRMDARKKVKLEALENGTTNDFSFSTATKTLPGAPLAETPEMPSRPFTGSFAGLDMLARCVDRVSKRMHERATSPEEDEADTPVVRVLGASPSEENFLLVSLTRLASAGETSLTHFFAQLQPSEDLQVAARQFGLAHRHDGSIQTGGGGGMAVHRAHGELTSELVLDLIRYYAKHVQPLFPVYSQEELASFDTLSPFAILSICAIAALSENYSYEVFDTVRAHLATAVEMFDPFSHSSLDNVQAILVMSQSPKLHGSNHAIAGSRVFMRSSAAVRMSQDIGLHRRPPANLSTAECNRRMRVWLCCVFSDSWYSARSGQPGIIDLDDCYDYLSEPFDQERHLVEQFKLAVLLKRSVRALNRMRLGRTTDQQLRAILADFDAWLARIPESLQFAGSDSSVQAGYLHALLSCFESIFLRPFVKQDRDVPSGIAFRPSPARWFAVVNRSQLTIDWLLQTPGVLSISHTAFYALTMSASVQFFQHVKTGDLRNLSALEAVNKGLFTWASRIKDGQLATRHKVHKVAFLLWQAAARRHFPSVGVKGKEVEQAVSGVSSARATRQSSPAPGTTAPTRIECATIVEASANVSTANSISPALPATVFPADALSMPPASAEQSATSSPPTTLPLPLSLAIPPLPPTEGGLPDWLQTEWQGWCDSLMTDEWGALLQEDGEWPSLPGMG